MTPLPSPRSSHSVLEVFVTFLRLGLTSFGGPVAHLAFFRRELVARRQWLSDQQFGRLLALCQFLPGPASSQLGFGLGLLRAGAWGGLAAFLGFTLPSAILMVLFARALPALGGADAQAVIHGLKLVALAAVAHAVMAMAKRLCPDAASATIAVASAAVVLLSTGLPAAAGAQLAAVVLGAVAGGLWLRGNVPAVDESSDSGATPSRRSTATVLLIAFCALLLVLPWIGAQFGAPAQVFNAFYRSGALVFGGGHVVLPLLEDAVVAPGWVSDDDFLAGYGAAQAVPGPMFSFSAFLGARLENGSSENGSSENGSLESGSLESGSSENGSLESGSLESGSLENGSLENGSWGWGGAGLALVGIFLPGFLLLSGVLPFWQDLSRRPQAANAVAGVNAAVVGLLAAALYDPVFTSAVRGTGDLAIATIGWLIIGPWRRSAGWLVLWSVSASWLATRLF